MRRHRVKFIFKKIEDALQRTQRMNGPPVPIEEALEALGELLRDSGERISLVVVGGATLNLLGIVSRSTSDVDVIARVSRGEDGALHLVPAEPFPDGLRRAIQTVARDFGLSEEWMNAVIGAQWAQGLPPRLLEETTWRVYGGALDVGLVGRRALIALKLFAAVDRGPRSVHMQDLFALEPTDEELAQAAAWVATQDAYADFTSLIDEAVEHVRGHRR